MRLSLSKDGRGYDRVGSSGSLVRGRGAEAYAWAPMERQTRSQRSLERRWPCEAASSRMGILGSKGTWARSTPPGAKNAAAVVSRSLEPKLPPIRRLETGDPKQARIVEENPSGGIYRRPAAAPMPRAPPPERWHSTRVEPSRRVAFSEEKPQEIEPEEPPQEIEPEEPSPTASRAASPEEALWSGPVADTDDEAPPENEERGAPGETDFDEDDGDYRDSEESDVDDWGRSQPQTPEQVTADITVNGRDPRYRPDDSASQSSEPRVVPAVVVLHPPADVAVSAEGAPPLSRVFGGWLRYTAGQNYAGTLEPNG